MICYCWLFAKDDGDDGDTHMTAPLGAGAAAAADAACYCLWRKSKHWTLLLAHDSLYMKFYNIFFLLSICSIARA